MRKESGFIPVCVEMARTLIRGIGLDQQSVGGYVPKYLALPMFPLMGEAAWHDYQLEPYRCWVLRNPSFLMFRKAPNLLNTDIFFSTLGFPEVPNQCVAQLQEC